MRVTRVVISGALSYLLTNLHHLWHAELRKAAPKAWPNMNLGTWWLEAESHKSIESGPVEDAHVCIGDP